MRWNEIYEENEMEWDLWRKLDGNKCRFCALIVTEYSIFDQKNVINVIGLL